jgi:phage terminase Nu1 subunit (DNA packaging protein)
MQGRLLNSWKEIADYLGWSVRTVQRWEARLGLPVRRPYAGHRGSVIAFKNEIDDWLRHAHLRSEMQPGVKEDVPCENTKLSKLG